MKTTNITDENVVDTVAKEVDPNEKQILNLPVRRLVIKPFTKKEIHDAGVERVHLISKEFSDGFNFLRNYPTSVTVFGGNMIKKDTHYYEKARKLAARIVNELKYAIVTGGGPGIMEAANQGASEANGQSIGLTIELPHEQLRNPYVNKYLNFHYFFSRKVCLGFSSEAYVFFPGGFGTMDELFEILTLVQTGKIEKIPIILVGTEFWTPFHELIKKQMLELGTIDPEDIDLYIITDDEDQIMQMIKDAPVKTGVELHH